MIYTVSSEVENDTIKDKSIQLHIRIAEEYKDVKNIKRSFYKDPLGRLYIELEFEGNRIGEKSVFKKIKERIVCIIVKIVKKKSN